MKVELKETEDYEGDERNRIHKIIFKNSKWDKLKLTSNFRSKYNEIDGTLTLENFKDARMSSLVHKDNNSYLYCVKLENGVVKYYSFVKIEDDNGYIDDVEVEELNYENISMEEAEKKYIIQFMK